MPKVSVIVPIYKVEQYIERCLISLFEQTLKDIEYIFVNDCSPDASMQILQSILDTYPNRQNQVIIINHHKNKGQARARTSGMKAMTGEYMIHCDPDDWIDKDMYEVLYTEAINSNSDIVCCNWCIEKGLTTIKQKIEYASFPQKSLIECRYNPSLCNKLIRSEIIKNNSIYPYSGINCGEDLNVVIRSFHYAKSLKYVDIYPYHYMMDNANSITHTNHKKQFYFSHKPNVENICKFLEDNDVDNNYIILKNYIKFIEKYGLISKSCKDFNLWCKTWPECHKYIKFFPLPSRYKYIMSMIADYPFLLKVYFEYLWWRSK